MKAHSLGRLTYVALVKGLNGNSKRPIIHYCKVLLTVITCVLKKVNKLLTPCDPFKAQRANTELLILMQLLR